MDKEAITQPKRAKQPQESPVELRPEMSTAEALPSSRRHHGGRPDVLVPSTKGKLSGRHKWLGLLDAEHSQSSFEASAEAAEVAPREPLGRAKVTSGNDGDTSTPLSPRKDRRSTGQASTSPAAPVPSPPRSGVQSPSKSPAYGSGRITAVATPEEGQSSQCFTPQHSRPLSPELTGSPPKIRVLVASTARSPKAQPYDGFPGVPLYIGAPEVIVFTPRGSPSGATTPMSRQDDVTDDAHQHTSAERSSLIEGRGVDEDTLINRREPLTLLQMWALCVVATSTLSLPLGLFILTYFSTGSGFRPSRFPEANRSTVSFSGFPSSSVITPDPFSGLPARCIRPVPLNDPNVSLSTSYSPAGFRRTQHNIFCVFNVSRLGRANSMTPMDMPLDYCTSIVYWSLGVVASGAVESRVDNFDKKDMGVYKWRIMLDLLGFHDTKIMLAVGGYPHESVFFSRLGRDSGAMARFVTSLMKMVLKASANGVLIDWAEPEPGCGRPEDRTTLSLLVDAIRRAYRVSGAVVGSGDIAVVIPKNVTVAKEVMDVVVDRVEWLFVQTHLVTPNLGYSSDYCVGWGREYGDLVRRLRGSGTYYVDKMCCSFSMAPFLAYGWTGRYAVFHISALSTATNPVTGRASTTSMVNVCGNSMDQLCKVHQDGKCLSFRNIRYAGNMSSLAPLYIFQDRDLLYSLLSKGTATRRLCAVVYDLDADNFKTPCPSLRADIFTGLTHLANVTENPHNDSGLGQRPFCP
ncbi:hypothetical protein HPB52_009685 [Rhipicephalus sanguineus]|uniref:GH18 domain-containing protein n=1 Tax=Rhipicephalus sanguineus TaxID=34632 RepID=A0A9D4PFI5_RHISA|nr:hypothetical protein HPB52_009685 [Rhipicephalus sanguineus]